MRAWLAGMNWKAVAVGWVIDIVGSTAAGVVALIAVLFSKRLELVDLADQAFVTRLVYSPEVLTASIVGGSVLAVVAGYVAARLAGTRELAHGVWSSAAGVAITLGSIRDVLAYLPAWLVIASLAAGPPIGLAGGWLRLVTKRSKEGAA